MSQIHVLVLLGAKQVLRRFVCPAVEDSSEKMEKESFWFQYSYRNKVRKAQFEIKRQISQDLGYFSHLESWAHRNYPESVFSKDDFYQMRLYWIDAMIEYWRDKP